MYDVLYFFHVKYLNCPKCGKEIELFKNGKSFELNGINHPIQADIVDSYAEFNTHQASIYLSPGDSSTFDMPDKSINLIITDPPFFDNIHYSQLADFFYYWLNQLLDISKKTTSREVAEVQDTNASLFTKKLTTVFTECHRLLHNKGLFIFTYHHSRHQGWLAIHQAIRCAGFICIQTYPIKAEMSVAVPLQQAKTPIHVDLIIVCKKQETSKSSFIPQTLIENAFATTSAQLKELADYIDISLGDAKVAFMGKLLCELSLVGELTKELNFLTHSKDKIDDKINELFQNIIHNNQRTISNVNCQPTQLNLFD